jgi:hypothetical protein
MPFQYLAHTTMNLNECYTSTINITGYHLLHDFIQIISAKKQYSERALLLCLLPEQIPRHCGHRFSCHKKKNSFYSLRSPFYQVSEGKEVIPVFNKYHVTMMHLLLN